MLTFSGNKGSLQIYYLLFPTGVLFFTNRKQLVNFNFLR